MDDTTPLLFEQGHGRPVHQAELHAVGMSTTPEVIVARHSDITVFGMSVITDVFHEEDTGNYVTDGEEIVRQADAAAVKMSALFKAIIERI